MIILVEATTTRPLSNIPSGHARKNNGIAHCLKIDPWVIFRVLGGLLPACAGVRFHVSRVSQKVQPPWLVPKRKRKQKGHAPEW